MQGLALRGEPAILAPMLWRKGYDIAKQTLFAFLDNGGSLLSASLAFYAILSVAPLVLVAISVAGWLFGQEVAAGQVSDGIAHYVGSGAARAVRSVADQLRDRTASKNATLIGFGILLFGAARLFGQVQDALNQLWHVRTEFRSLKSGLLTTIYKKLMAFVMVFTLGGVVGLVILASALAATVKTVLGSRVPGSELVWSLAPVATAVSVVFVLFTLCYRLMPDAQVSWRDAASGGAVGALIFVLAEYPLSFYLSHQGVESAYGAAGSLVVFLLWVYYAAHVFFLGAQLTYVLAERSGRGVSPDAMAVLVRQVPVSDAHDASQKNTDEKAFTASHDSGSSMHHGVKRLP